jgi:hypothetical protein
MQCKPLIYGQEGQISGQSLLDLNTTCNSTYDNCHSYKRYIRRPWTNKQKSCYRRIKSGIARHKGENLRFLTLSSEKNMIRSLTQSLDCLKTLIRKYTPHRLYKEGYLTKPDMYYFYGRKNIFKPLNFQYLKVRTSEGKAWGVFHILYFGSYLPYNFLSETWLYYTGTAWAVDIRATKKRTRGNQSVRKLSRYCINQYVINQFTETGESAFVNYSASLNWSVPHYSQNYQFYKQRLRTKYNTNGVWEYEEMEEKWLTYCSQYDHPPPRYTELEDYT